MRDFLILISAVMRASVAIVSQGKAEPDPLMMLKSRIGRTFILPVVGPMELALKGEEPTYIIFAEATTARTEQPVHVTKGLTCALEHLFAPIFLTFFERYNLWLTATLGDAVNWPPVLNFARVVKNGISHGSIDIRNPSAAAVSWRGFSYSHADKGRQIIGPDLSLGEMIALMLDVDDALESVAAPIL